MKKKGYKKEFLSLIFTLFNWILMIPPALAESQSEMQLSRFLEGVADFLIRIVGPGVLVIGVAMGGIAMATGDERGLRRGIYAALGGALIMMARSILDLIQRVAGF